MADVKVPNVDERYSGLETVASGKCTKKLVAHRRGPLNYRVEGRNFIVGLSGLDMANQDTYKGKWYDEQGQRQQSDDREWYIWECPQKFLGKKEIGLS